MPANAPGRQDGTSTLVGIALFVAFVALFFNIVTLPRTPLGEREALRAFHDTLGLIVFLLAAWKLWLMRTRTQPPEGLPAASFGFSRAILFALLLTFVAEGVIGLIYGWAEFHREVVWFGWQLPNPLADNDRVRKTFGYLHSAFGFYYLFLITIWLVFGIYQHVHYRCGLRRLLPGARV